MREQVGIEFYQVVSKHLIMSKAVLSWLIVGIIVLGILGIWMITIHDGNRILNRGNKHNTEAVPYD
jgi:hypothetical protein